MRDEIREVLFSEQDLMDRVARLGAEITRDYAGKDLLLVGVLKGCFIFMADLLRHIPLNCELDFMAVSSYGSGTKTTGAVNITKDLSRDIENRHVIVVEDILDSGVTLSYLMGYLGGRKPASLKICTLLDKPSRRIAPIKADYCGFECPDEFIVGYGLDYDERYRNLPYIGVLKPEAYSR